MIRGDGLRIQGKKVLSNKDIFLSHLSSDVGPKTLVGLEIDFPGPRYEFDIQNGVVGGGQDGNFFSEITVNVSHNFMPPPQVLSMKV